MKHLKIAIVSFGTILTLLTSCNGPDQNQQNILANEQQKNEIRISPEVLEQMIHSLPKPIEMAGIISNSKVDLTEENLVPTSRSTEVRDSYKQAMIFGAYGVDLGYINMKGKKLYSLNYLEALKNISTEMKIDHHFDFSQMAEYANTENHPDSLVLLYTKNFNTIDAHLREQQRGEMSALILIGAWLEGMNMLSELYTQTSIEDIRQRIAEQKVVFDNINALLTEMQGMQFFGDLRTAFLVLKQKYDMVKITYIHHEPEMIEENGQLVFKDKTETKVECQEKDILDIIQELKILRTKYFLN